jgi:hypothetical protein
LSTWRWPVRSPWGRPPRAWLTKPGHEALRRDREVLSVDMLAGAMTRLPASQAEDLIIGLRALVDLADPALETRTDP